MSNYEYMKIYTSNFKIEFEMQKLQGVNMIFILFLFFKMKKVSQFC